MRMSRIIRKKQLGQELSQEEINFFVRDYTSGKIGDDQAAALCMALWFNSMKKEETGNLTLAMAASGDKVDLSSIEGVKVDKHSSGGVADTTTLVLAPLVAACGGRVAKMSGRGLGHSGGTLDKLESIPGYNVHQDMENFIRIVNTCGASVIGQTASLAPADKKLYALRDVTSTVDSMPLIASSIMSKKLAAGGDKILLDVKWGNGAFMPAVEKAVELAQIMVDIGEHAGVPTQAMVTDMNQPLGNAVGNALEVVEAVEILRNERIHGALRELAMELGTAMLVMGNVAKSPEEARNKLEHALSSGAALTKLGEMVKLHGGDPSFCEDLSRLPQARQVLPVLSPRKGYVVRMDTSGLGRASVMLGAGRERKDDSIDHGVGFWIHKRLGDWVERGEPLGVLHVNDTTNQEGAQKLFLESFVFGDASEKKEPLVVRTL